MAGGYLCPACSKVVTATKNNRYRSHKTGSGEGCQMSSEPIPEHLLEQPPLDGKASPGVPVEGMDFSKCPHCTRAVKLTRLGYFEPHDQTLRGGDRCPNSGVRFRPLKPTEDVPLPGDSTPSGKSLYQTTHPRVSAQMEVEQERIGVPRAPAGPKADGAASSLSLKESAEWPSAPDAPSGASTEKNSPESTSTSTPSPELPSGSVAGRYLQPPPYVEPSRYLQPLEWTGTAKAGEMTPYAKEVATRIKETFYSYSNRKSADNRSAQTTLGPSEIGTPCDRRLAMALMNIPPVNPGGDGWASFVGTCGHTGMGEVYQFADAGTGRYVVEMPLKFPAALVPRGTTDLLDRRYGDITDWKFMGAYSLKKFKLEGPSDTYRIQAQTYGLGAELAGEVVKNVVIVGLPRAGSSLDEMWVWEQKYDRKVGRAALDRVQKIADDVTRMSGQVAYNGTGPASPMEAAQVFSTADAGECKWCPFSNPRDKGFQRGCPGP